MGTPQPNRLPRILGSLLLGLVVAFGIVRSTFVQTYLCTSALNRWTQSNGMAWEIGNVEIRLFPLRINADEIKVQLADGNVASIAAFEAEVDAAAWIGGEKRIRRVHLAGVDVTIGSMDVFHSTSKDAEPTLFELAIDDLKADRVTVSAQDSAWPQPLAWEQLHANQIQWGPAGISGTVEVRDATLAPPYAAKHSSLRALNGITAADALTIQAYPSDSAQHWTVRASSNWGEVEVHAASSSAALNVNVDWVPDPVHWPIDSAASWSPTLARIIGHERLAAQINLPVTGGAHGQLEWAGLAVPWNWHEDQRGFGPVAVDEAEYTAWAALFGFSLPAYLTDHRTWVIEVTHNQHDWRAKAFPLGSRNKEMTLVWDGGIEQAEIQASLRGFAIDAEGPALKSGRWMSTGTVYRDGTAWHGSLNTSHPAGDAISTQWNAEWADSTWIVETATQIEKLSSAPAGATPPWELHAQLNWRASGTGLDSWIQIAELRNIVLLENGAPRVFNRFDAIQSKRGDAWTLKWDSDLTNGTFACNTAALSDWRFDLWSMDWKPIGPVPAAQPEVEVSASFTNFHPISLLANLPFTAPEPFELGASWRGKDGNVHAQIPKVTAGIWDVENISLQGTLGTGDGYALAVSLGTITYEDTPYVQEISANAITDAKGLSVFIDSLSGHLMNENFSLSQPLHARWDKSTLLTSVESFALQSDHGRITCSGNYASDQEWNFAGTVQVDSVSFAWDQAPLAMENLTGNWSVRSQAAAPVLGASLDLDGAEWKSFNVQSMHLEANGAVMSPRLAFTARVDSAALLEGAVNVPLNAVQHTEGRVRFEGFPLRTINAFMPPASIELDGVAHGSLAISTERGMPAFKGEISVTNAQLAVPYLGTHYGIHGTVSVRPEGFYMDQWRLVDRAGRTARFNGTALHSAFGDWSLDFGVDATEEPVELMNIPVSDDALFYGTASGTGDINISGYGPYLQFDAQLATGDGTEFALPMDSRSDVNHAEFIRFQTADTAVMPVNQPRGVFSDITLNLGIDVRDGAQASIVFDRNVGDEIVGKARGHLDLEIDDFERLSMTGDLEITEGAYYFTLQNWLNKRFDIRPGSTIAWQGDPYDAQLDIATLYTARTKLDPLLPEVPDLPGRLPIDLGLALKGSLLSPDLDFNIDAPTADSRIRALMDGALISEEEVQRQALGLLVMNQFIPANPTEAAVGGFIQPAQSTQFLANQLGHWISQIAPSMDVGLDYAQDALSGEQALGLALSTQLWNDRLHIEGELGAQALGQVHAEDVQIQDLTVSFDLSPEGNVQLTGHSRQNANLTSTIEGQTVQGVGLRFKWSFDKWGDWKSK